MILKINCYILSFIALLALSGCIAVWGAAHKVVSADENGIKIQNYKLC